MKVRIGATTIVLSEADKRCRMTELDAMVQAKNLCEQLGPEWFPVVVRVRHEAPTKDDSPKKVRAAFVARDAEKNYIGFAQFGTEAQAATVYGCDARGRGAHGESHVMHAFGMRFVANAATAVATRGALAFAEAINSPGSPE